METADTFGAWLAVETAVSKSEYEFELASYNTMVALGAIEWAHSTSSASSMSHVPRLALAGSDVPPVSLRTLSVGPPLTLNCCRPNWLLKLLASAIMFGSLYASTIAIV